MKNDMIRAGVGARNGFGWNIGPMDLIPFSGYSFDASRSTFTPTGELTPADSAFVQRLPSSHSD